MASAHDHALFLNLLPENRKQQPDSRNLCIRAILTHFLPGLDVLLGSQLLIPIKFCHGIFWQTWRITMFFTYSEVFWKARCLVVYFLLLVNMHIVCPVFDSNDIWSIFRGIHWLDQTFALSWNSRSILWSLKHPGFPHPNYNSVLLIYSIRALPHTFRDAPNSTQPTSAFDYQSDISVSSITQTMQLLVSSGWNRKQYGGISTHPRFLDKQMVPEKLTFSPAQPARRDVQQQKFIPAWAVKILHQRWTWLWKVLAEFRACLSGEYLMYLDFIQVQRKHQRGTRCARWKGTKWWHVCTAVWPEQYSIYQKLNIYSKQGFWTLSVTV